LRLPPADGDPTVSSGTAAKSSRDRDPIVTGQRRPAANLIGIDDGPFDRNSRGSVLVVGAVFAGTRLDGVVSTRVRRDGADATGAIQRMIAGSRFGEQLQAVLLQGIAVAGFNVVDLRALADALGLPVIVVARRPPKLDEIRAALFRNVRGATRKWRLIERAGPMEQVGPVWIQRAGITLDDAARVLARATIHGHVPEPLRVAHLVAGGLVRGESRGRA
jgi:endonuclease V-like protein UPF0215 family